MKSSSSYKDTKSKIMWQKAMVDASVLKGDFRLNWQQIESVDPILYEFYTRFGTNLVSLRLVGVGLSELPPELCTNLACLQLMSLANNNLTRLPDSIVNMTNLRDLSLIYNKIVKLPDRIGLLCSLQKIGINNNCLESLPVTFGALNMLQRVDLGMICALKSLIAKKSVNNPRFYDRM
jgi:Leucine-rich repeat (LRR) protein